MNKGLKILLGFLFVSGLIAAGLFVPEWTAPMPEGTPHGEHWNLLVQFFPGLVHNLHGMVAGTPTFVAAEEPPMITHVLTAILVVAIVLLLAVLARRSMDRKERLIPDAGLTPFSFLDLLTDVVLGFMEGLMGRKKAETYFPLIASLALFILISNLMGLLPGMAPPTDSLNTTFALGVVVFVATHIWGFKVHGIAYLKHFMGPFLKWYALPLIILMFAVELISNFVRPCSLALRLMGNMMGDHKVLFAFMGFGILFAPLPIMALGVIVSFVQTLVFCLLSIIYIGLATEEHH